MEDKTIGFAVCGSFCTHAKAMEALEQVKARFQRVVPIVSETAADTDTRFGTAHDLMREMERICDHLLIAPSTNDGLSASAASIGALLPRKYIYFVPFGQDDFEKKPTSLVADFSQVADAAQAALEGCQLQPLLLRA